WTSTSARHSELADAEHSEDVSETLAQVLTKQPDWHRIPVRARMLIQACLEKDPKRRLRDIGDAQRLLQDHQRSVVARHRGSHVPLLVAGQSLSWIFCGWKTEEAGYIRWTAGQACRCHGRTRRYVEQR